MDSLVLPILIAATVMLATFGLVKVVHSPDRKQKRKLTERLSTERPYDAPASPAGTTPAGAPIKSITYQTEVQGLPPFLAKLAFIQNLNRSLIQAWPDRKIGNFLLIAGGAAVTGLMMAMMVCDSLLIPMLAAGGCGYVPFFVLA